MTERLYYHDAYLRAFDARVLDRSGDGRRIYLDRSAFYPTSGGQPHDTGTLGGARVVDVIDEAARVAHVLDAPLPEVAAVHGTIDWARRYDHMQQHTGQHLLSAVFVELYRLETASVHFGDERSTLDLATEQLDEQQVVAAERRANEIVTENRVVTVSVEPAETAAGLRKVPTRAGELRIVTIDALDRSACGGTHVRATGEIGAILCRRTERVRKTTRVEFTCGARAIWRARAEYAMLSDLARHFTASVEEVPGLVRAQHAELRAAETARRELLTRLATLDAQARWSLAAPDANGVRRLVDHRASGNVEEIRAVAQAVQALPRTLYVGALDAPPTLVVATSADSDLDAGAMLKSALADVGGRGGGSPRLAQGTAPDHDAIARAMARLGAR